MTSGRHARVFGTLRKAYNPAMHRFRARPDRVVGGLLLSALLVVSCSPTGGVDVDPNTCPVGSSGRALLEEFVDETVRDAVFVADGSLEQQHAFALSLLGVDAGYAGVAGANEACIEAVEFDARCASEFETSGGPSDPFWTNHDRCAQLSCAAADVSVVTVYVTTVPVTDPADRHTVEYAADSPAGHIVYDINPLIAWRIDRSNPQTTRISAELVGGILFTGADGAGADLTHSGEITVQKVNDLLETGSLEVLFPSLSSFRTMEVMALIGSDASVSGTVTADGETVATISTSGDGRTTFAWVGDCAP